MLANYCLPFPPIFCNEHTALLTPGAFGGKELCIQKSDDWEDAPADNIFAPKIRAERPSSTSPLTLF